MPSHPGSSRQHLPLPPLDLQILTLLSSRALHGYGLVQAWAEEFPDQPAIEIGSLYRIIARLMDEGLIREVEGPRAAPADRRVRRFYTVTVQGQKAARAEALRLRSLLASPAIRRLLGADR
jgi:DNA-binding PadR family transcriptional regulator